MQDAVLKLNMGRSGRPSAGQERSAEDGARPKPEAEHFRLLASQPEFSDFVLPREDQTITLLGRNSGVHVQERNLVV